MNEFYAALQQPGITKAEALRQAQIALIPVDYSALGEAERTTIALEYKNRFGTIKVTCSPQPS